MLEIGRSSILSWSRNASHCCSMDSFFCSIWYKVSYKVMKWLFAIFFYKFINTTFSTHIFLQQLQQWMMID
jgi:hypothetical protein